MSDGITPLTPSQEQAREQKAIHEPYPERVAIALDEDLNVDTGGLPDETISSRWARAAEQGKWWGVLGSKFLDLFQRDHGAQAQAGDVARADKVVATEENSGGLPK